MNNVKIDKLHHFIYSYAICISLCLLLSFFKYGLLTAFLITMIIGISKEIYDKFSPDHNAEWNDIVADVLGSISAIIIFGVCSLWL